MQCNPGALRENNLTRVRVQLTRNHPEERGLPRSVWPNHSQALPGGQLEGNPGKERSGPEGLGESGDEHGRVG